MCIFERMQILPAKNNHKLKSWAFYLFRGCETIQCQIQHTMVLGGCISCGQKDCRGGCSCWDQPQARHRCRVPQVCCRTASECLCRNTGIQNTCGALPNTPDQIDLLPVIPDWAVPKDQLSILQFEATENLHPILHEHSKHFFATPVGGLWLSATQKEFSFGIPGKKITFRHVTPAGSQCPLAPPATPPASPPRGCLLPPAPATAEHLPALHGDPRATHGRSRPAEVAMDSHGWPRMADSYHLGPQVLYISLLGQDWNSLGPQSIQAESDMAVAGHGIMNCRRKHFQPPQRNPSLPASSAPSASACFNLVGCAPTKHTRGTLWRTRSTCSSNKPAQHQALWQRHTRKGDTDTIRLCDI